MKIKLHKAEERGHQDHGWLKANHSFSFASYHHPDKMNFGVLRVLNDDYVAAGQGFGMHPHANMEIITIPLSGELHHKDSMGNSGAIKRGEIQVMSAGTGIQHSEFNGSSTEPVTLLQIWIIPNKLNVDPRYDQLTYNAKNNHFIQIISPNADDEGSWIHQDAWFHLGSFTEDNASVYTLKNKNNGLYIFLISGKVNIEGYTLETKDALAITDVSKIDLNILANSQILIMEVPMDLPTL